MKSEPKECPVHKTFGCYCTPRPNFFGEQGLRALKEDAVSQLLYQSYKDFHGFVADYPNEHNHKLIGIFKAQAKSIVAHFALPVMKKVNHIPAKGKNETRRTVFRR